MSRYLALSPWAKDALTQAELDAILGRAVALGAHVSAGASRGHAGRWSVWATSRDIRTGRDDCRGSLADAINRRLDDFRDQAEAIAAELAAIDFPEGLAMVWCSSCENPALVNLEGEGWCGPCLAKRPVAV